MPFYKIIISLSIILCGSQVTQPTNESSDKIVVGDKAPAFTVKTINNSIISINELRGKYVLINFFATWCSSCMKELPYIEKIHHKFKNKNIVIIAIGREHDMAELVAFNKEKHYTFNIATDPNRIIYNLFATKYVPRNYIISPKGKIIYQHTGFSKKEIKKIESILQRASK